MPSATPCSGVLYCVCYVYFDAELPQKVSTNFGIFQNKNGVAIFKPPHRMTFQLSIWQIVLEERTVSEQIERIGHIIHKETTQILQRVALRCGKLADVGTRFVVDNHP